MPKNEENSKEQSDEASEQPHPYPSESQSPSALLLSPEHLVDVSKQGPLHEPEEQVLKGVQFTLEGVHGRPVAEISGEVPDMKSSRDHLHISRSLT